MNNIFYLDIETIPSQEGWVKEKIEESISHPKTMKKEETIKNWYETEFDVAVEKALEKTSFNGAMNHIVCVSVAKNDDAPKAFYIKNVIDEKKNLEMFFDYIRSDAEIGDVFCGHNISGFDMKIIKQRAIILDLVIPSFLPVNTKPWDRNPFDTMIQWDSREFISMDTLLKAMKYEGGKGDVDGSMVYGMWKQKRFEEIAKYCNEDVEKVRFIAKKMM